MRKIAGALTAKYEPQAIETQSVKLANIIRLEGLADKLGYCTPGTRFLEARWFRLALESCRPTYHQSSKPSLDEFRSCRQSLLGGPLPPQINDELEGIFLTLARAGVRLSVRSCFELEDQTNAGFAGTFHTVLDVASLEQLREAVQTVYASVFSDRAFEELQAAGVNYVPGMAVAIQEMVGGAGWLGGVTQTQASELAPFPLMSFTVSSNAVAVTSGADIPEDYLVARENLGTSHRVIAHAQPGTATRDRFSLSDDEIRRVAQILLGVEEAFGEPLELEWSLSPSQDLYLLQARPVAVHYASAVSVAASDSLERLLCAGLPIGNGRVTGKVRFATTPEEALAAPQGGVLAVARQTDADWAVAVRHATALVTVAGSRGSHFARISREAQKIAVVGCGDALFRLKEGETVTVFCAEGVHGAVYRGDVPAGQLQLSTDDIVVRSAASAFSQARITRPENVKLDPTDIVTALRLPNSDDERSSARLSRRIAGYANLDDFVENRLREEIALIGVAFPRSRIAVLPAVPARWREHLSRAVDACQMDYGMSVVEVGQ